MQLFQILLLTRTARTIRDCRGPFNYVTAEQLTARAPHCCRKRSREDPREHLKQTRADHLFPVRAVQRRVRGKEHVHRRQDNIDILLLVLRVGLHLVLDIVLCKPALRMGTFSRNESLIINLRDRAMHSARIICRNLPAAPETFLFVNSPFDCCD